MRLNEIARRLADRVLLPFKQASATATGTPPPLTAELFVEELNQRLTLLLPDGSRRDFGQLLDLAVSKGDLLIATAARRFRRLPVGSDGQVLTADSSSPTGHAWADAGASAPPTAARRHLAWSVPTTTGTPVGAPYSNGAASGTLIVLNGTSSCWAIRRTSTTAGNIAGYRWQGTSTAGILQQRHLVSLDTRFCVFIVGNSRFFVGLIACNVGTISNSDNFGAVAHIGIRHSAAADGGWVLSIHDGTTHTTHAMGITVTADTVYSLRIERDSGSGDVTVTINGTYTHTVSADLPADTTLWEWACVVLNKAGGANPTPEIALASLHLECL